MFVCRCLNVGVETKSQPNHTKIIPKINAVPGIADYECLEFIKTVSAHTAFSRPDSRLLLLGHCLCEKQNNRKIQNSKQKREKKSETSDFKTTSKSKSIFTVQQQSLRHIATQISLSLACANVTFLCCTLLFTLHTKRPTNSKKTTMCE